MPIKQNVLAGRTVAAIERLERAMNTATGSTITADCADISALIDSIDDLLNTWNNHDTLHNMSSSDLGYFIREMSSELWVRMMAVEFSTGGGDQ